MADIQLLLSNEANRRALATIIDDRHTSITEVDLQTADLYLVDDASLPQYQEELQAHKREKHPIFCPVILIRREQTPITVDLPVPETSEHPLLINEILTAPVEKPVLFRRIANLLARRQQTATLQAKNERLEKFANAIRHEVRNPITILDGWLDIAYERGDEQAYERCQSAVNQVKRIVESTVVLLEKGESEIDPRPVELSGVCEESWEMVPNTAASIEIATSKQIAADEARLKQLLSNLFRNAIEHGGDDVTVRIGDLDDGFYVEDDGPGIPEEKRGIVFEEGYSSSGAGSGLGLAVVRKVAQFHNWKIGVKVGSIGGARFEISGCEITGQQEADPLTQTDFA